MRQRKAPLINAKLKTAVKSALADGPISASLLRCRLAENGVTLSVGSFHLEMDVLEQAQVVKCKSKTSSVDDVDTTERWFELC